MAEDILPQQKSGPGYSKESLNDLNTDSMFGVGVTTGNQEIANKDKTIFCIEIGDIYCCCCGNGGGSAQMKKVD